MVMSHRKLWIMYGSLDWTKSNLELGRQVNKSRERMRQIRNILGKPKVEARGRPRLVKIAA